MSKINSESPLVKSVLALDEYLSELERVGAKINSMPLKSDFDREHMQKLMGRFAECGQGVAAEVTNLSTQLNEARARAEAVAQGVAARAESLNVVKSEESDKLEQFRMLGEKVKGLNVAMSALRRPEGETISTEERAQLTASLAEFDLQLEPLIEEAQSLRKSAQAAKLKSLEANADSLAQTLQAVRTKLRSLSPSPTLPN